MAGQLLLKSGWPNKRGRACPLGLGYGVLWGCPTAELRSRPILGPIVTIIIVPFRVCFQLMAKQYFVVVEE